ncbi:hypothetical protein LZ30DRAFT_684970 [Colletotrichum cereale]|nr:hypothetical protein LZ30DRAFT_684970 [Colletotrichum cereale]
MDKAQGRTARYRQVLGQPHYGRCHARAALPGLHCLLGPAWFVEFVCALTELSGLSGKRTKRSLKMACQGSGRLKVELSIIAFVSASVQCTCVSGDSGDRFCIYGTISG